MTETADNEIKLNFEVDHDLQGEVASSKNDGPDGLLSEGKSTVKEDSRNSISKVPLMAIDEMTAEELVVHVAN